MPPPSPSNRSANKLLSRLATAEFDLLEPHLKAVELPVRKLLENRDTPIEHVYFIEHGFASVVADGAGKRSIEVGVIGREGMTGLAVLMGASQSPHETYMQASGDGQSLPASKLRQLIGQSASLHRTFLRYGYAFVIQTAQTAMANGRSRLEDRLARWLLMAQDRLDGDDVPLTHEFLSIMLGVRRPGVTIALNLLEYRGLIQARRGGVTIVDRAGLLETSNGAYGASEAEFQRLFG